MISRGWGEERERELLFNGYRVSVLQDGKRVLEKVVQHYET